MESSYPNNFFKDFSCHLKYGLYWEEGDIHKEVLNFSIENKLVLLRSHYDSDGLKRQIYPTKKLKELLTTNEVGCWKVTR